MTMVCGTDFSENAVLAARAAGAIATRLAVPLKLVHVIDVRGAECRVGGPHDAVDDPLRARRRAPAEELRAWCGIDVEALAVSGVAAERAVHTESNCDGRHVCAPHPGCITHQDVSRRQTMQCQDCDIPLQIIRSQDLALYYCRRCGALYEVIGGESCAEGRDAEARNRLHRWH